MDTNFTNRHRYFLQFVLSNGLVSLKNALDFLKEMNPEQSSFAHLKILIIEINREITKQFYKIVQTVCEVTNEEVIVWLCTRNDAISRLQVAYSQIELEYFDTLMKEIISSEDHRITYPRAINITSTLTANLSRENGEKALIKWIDNGYFVKKQDVFLGPRLILEFTAYLKNNTENCNCSLCSELVFNGKNCDSCNNTFHSFCIEKYLKNQNNCPNCKTEWGNMENESQPGRNIRR